MEIILPARQPFSLTAVIHSHGWVQLAPFSRPAPDELGYVTQLRNGRVLPLHITAAKDGVRAATEDLSDAEETELRRQITWMLGLDEDLTHFYAVAETEPKLAHVIAEARGRILRSATLFEDTVKTILTTNTAWSGTIRMAQNVVERYGPPLPADPSRRAFPGPAQLAQATPDDLRETGLGYRAPYVSELANRIAAGELDLESLKTAVLPTPDLRKQLLALKGVGAYAAANLLMLLGRHDDLPIDSWALKMVSHEWHNGEKIAKADVEAAFAKWGDKKGLAYWFWNWSYKS